MTKTTKPDPTGVDDPNAPTQLPADRPGLKPHPDHELPEQPDTPDKPGRPGKPDQGLPGDGKPGDGDTKPEAKTKTGAVGPHATPAVIFADGPYQGAESLPAGAVEGPGNELHVMHDTGLLVYMRADPTATPASDVPAYRLLRTEPVYRTATGPPVLEPPAGDVLGQHEHADRDATDTEKDAKDTAARNPKSRDVKA